MVCTGNSRLNPAGDNNDYFHAAKDLVKTNINIEGNGDIAYSNGSSSILSVSLKEWRAALEALYTEPKTYGII